MPTERHGKVRRLLRDGRACVVKLEPFTIQLSYESNTYKQNITLGVDAGSVHIGLSATTESKELFSAEVILRRDISEKIFSRKMNRENRRTRKLRHREMRRNNRRRKSDWFAPSIQYKIDSHLKSIRLVNSILPVKNIVIETANFDIQKIHNGSLSGTDYQQGEQEGFWNVREFVLSRDSHKCQHCKGKSGDNVLNVHHIESRKTGGDAPNNLITLCETCHKAFHRGDIKINIKRGLVTKDMSAMNTTRYAIYNKAKEEFENVSMTFGYITKDTRIKNSIPKTHCSDAYCITRNVNALRAERFYKIRLLQRHRRVLHVTNPRKGGLRRSNTTGHWIGKSKLQRFDTVVWRGIRCFIYGSTNGRAYLKDIDGARVMDGASVNVKYIKFIHRNKGFLITKLFNI